MPTRRTVVRIDEELCNGCGLCAMACAEGAIAIVDGKARLISDSYCDGLGACLGECPQGALTTEIREAEEFDEAAVKAHLAWQGKGLNARRHEAKAESLHAACPGSAALSIDREAAGVGTPALQQDSETPSRLGNWPVQIMLVPPTAPYLKGARLVIAADCTAFAYADFHRRFLGDPLGKLGAGRVLLVGCPKLDDVALYRTKLAQVIGSNDIREIEVVYMEVPCCSGLVRVVREASAEAGQQIPLTLTKIGIRGEVKERTTQEAAGKRD
jgi:Pyruvate/2-oxoacid:ferredoxin oxidoreductase delta subunit